MGASLPPGSAQPAPDSRPRDPDSGSGPAPAPAPGRNVPAPLSQGGPAFAVHPALSDGLVQQLLEGGQDLQGHLPRLEGRFRDLLFFQEALARGWARLSASGSWSRLEWRTGPEIDQALGGLARDPRKMHWFRASRLAAQARGFPPDALRRGHRLVVEAHEGMVSGSVPSALQLEFLLMRLLAPGGT